MPTMPKHSKLSPLATQIAATQRRHDNENPLWQGPCGEGPLGGITQSMLVRFLSCRERFRLRYVLGLEPPDKWNHRLGYGNMWHVCEEALSGCSIEPSPAIWELPLRSHAEELSRRYPTQREEMLKWYSVCLVQFSEYVKYWAEHSDVQNRTPLMQEQVFDVPYSLPSGRVVRLRGKFDSVDLVDGGVYLQENKTKGDIDRLQIERQLRFDLQTMLYLVALERFSHSVNDLPVGGYGRQIRGVRYNVVRRPLSGGIGNIKPHGAKSTKTKYTPAESDAEFYERLRRDYIAADPGYWFFRVRTEIDARDLQVFRGTCLDPLLEQLCCWYDEVVTKKFSNYGFPPLNYRTPFGLFNSLMENGSTEYDAYLESGSESGLRRITTLFGELQ